MQWKQPWVTDTSVLCDQESFICPIPTKNHRVSPRRLQATRTRRDKLKLIIRALLRHLIGSVQKNWTPHGSCCVMIYMLACVEEAPADTSILLRLKIPRADIFLWPFGLKLFLIWSHCNWSVSQHNETQTCLVTSLYGYDRFSLTILLSYLSKKRFISVDSACEVEA